MLPEESIGKHGGSVKMTSGSLLARIEEYLENNETIQEIGNIQKNLRPPVGVEERNERVRMLLEIRDNGRLLRDEVSGNKSASGIPESVVKKINEIIERADHLKRENCLLMIADHEPFSVLKPDELCIFTEKSRNNLVEVRKYYGMHKNLFYDDGPCVSMAVTRPKLVQNYHSHTSMDEYTIVLLGSILVKARIGEKLETLKAEESDIIYVKKDTVHTLFNKTRKNALNATVKVPVGFMDRKHIETIPRKGEGEINVLKLKPTQKPWGALKSKTIKECGYEYQVDYMSVDPLAGLTSPGDRDTTIYVIDGEIHLQSAGKTAVAGRDHLIFITKGTETTIKNVSEKSTADLYVTSETKNSS